MQVIFWIDRLVVLTLVSACDFLLWGYLKEQVYLHGFNNDEELKRTIEEDLLQIPQIFIPKAFDSFVLNVVTNVSQ